MDGTSTGCASCAVSGGATACCATAFPAYPMSITLNIAAWAIPVTVTLVHNVAAANFFGEVGGLLAAASSSSGTPTALGPGTSSFTSVTVTNGNYATVTLSVPAYSTSALVAPTAAMAQTEAQGTLTDAATLRAGANAGAPLAGASALTVSTSVTAVHDATSFALVRFSFTATYVLTAVLELTLATAPANTMLLAVVGVNPAQAAGSWAAASITWTSATFITNGMAPSGVIASPAQNFVRLDNGNMVAGHMTAASTTAARAHRLRYVHARLHRP